MARFCPLFSGSSGNSIYIGSSDGGILIDVGMNAKQTTLALDRLGIDADSIKAIFVTHEHSDHIQGLRVFASKNVINVYSSQGTLSALDNMGVLNEKFKALDIESGVDVCGMQVMSFRTSHDSAESVGYVIKTPDSRRIGVATDLGVMTDEVFGALSGCDLVLLESNHDIKMLENGPYPYYLKRRILSEKGHLSNKTCGETLVKLVKNGTTRFVLGHLSRENNTPDLAYQNAYSALACEGAVLGQDFLLSVAPKCDPEKVMVF